MTLNKDEAGLSTFAMLFSLIDINKLCLCIIILDQGSAAYSPLARFGSPNKIIQPMTC